MKTYQVLAIHGGYCCRMGEFDEYAAGCAAAQYAYAWHNKGTAPCDTLVAKVVRKFVKPRKGKISRPRTLAPRKDGDKP